MTGGDAGGWALGMGAGLGNNSTRLISASDSLRLDHRARYPRSVRGWWRAGKSAPTPHIYIEGPGSARMRRHTAGPPLAAGRRLLLALWLFAACKARPLALSKYGVDDVFAARHLPQQCLVTLQLCCGNPRDVKKRLQVRHCSSFFVRLRFVCFFLVCACSSDAVPVNEQRGRRQTTFAGLSSIARSRPLAPAQRLRCARYSASEYWWVRHVQ